MPSKLQAGGMNIPSMAEIKGIEAEREITLERTVDSWLKELLDSDELEIPEPQKVLENVTSGAPESAVGKLFDIKSAFPTFGPISQKMRPFLVDTSQPVTEEGRKEIVKSMLDADIVPMITTYHRIVNLLPSIRRLRKDMHDETIDIRSIKIVYTDLRNAIMSLTDNGSLRSVIHVSPHIGADHRDQMTVEEYGREAGTAGRNPQRKVSGPELLDILEYIKANLKTNFS